MLHGSTKTQPRSVMKPEAASINSYPMTVTSVGLFCPLNPRHCISSATVWKLLTPWRYADFPKAGTFYEAVFLKPNTTLSGKVFKYRTRNFSGKDTGLGCHFLLQRIFPTQGSNLCLLCLLHWQMDSLQLYLLGNPNMYYMTIYNEACSQLDIREGHFLPFTVN